GTPINMRMEWPEVVQARPAMACTAFGAGPAHARAPRSPLMLAPRPGAPPAAPQGPPSSVEGMEPAPGVPSLLQSGVPAIPPELKSRTGQYLNARAASLADVSEDGDALLITTRFASTAQLHVVEMPLGTRTQITFGDEPVDEARCQPGDPQPGGHLRATGGGEF